MSRSTRERLRQAGLDRKLASYALAGGALVAATARDAAAGIVTVPINETIGTGLSQTSLTVMAGSNDVVTFSTSLMQGAAEFNVTSFADTGYIVTDPAVNDGLPVALMAGDIVGPSSLYNIGSPFSPTKLMAEYNNSLPQGHFV